MREEHIERRQFLRQTAAGATWAVASAATAAEIPDSPPATLRDGRATMETHADVLVVGGGTAGTVAAIQAARIGAKTLLVEHGSQLGGTMTVGGVAFPGLFHAWGKQVIGGIGWDLVRQTVELDGGRLPDFATPAPPGRHWVHQVLINPFLYAVLAEEACRLAGVEVCYYEFPVAAQPGQNGWRVEVFGPGTRRQVTCRQLIDCTGGADVVGMLGLERLREDETQPDGSRAQRQQRSPGQFRPAGPGCVHGDGASRRRRRSPGCRRKNLTPGSPVRGTESGPPAARSHRAMNRIPAKRLGRGPFVLAFVAAFRYRERLVG